MEPLEGKMQETPVRRAHIPKGDGHKTRPIDVPTVEDQILQRAVAMVMEAVYALGMIRMARPTVVGHERGRRKRDYRFDCGTRV